MTSYVPKGVCSRRIDFTIDDQGLVHDVTFIKGCAGNSQGLSRLAEGQPAEHLIALLHDTQCGIRGTSCPAQLALALQEELDRRAG